MVSLLQINKALKSLKEPRFRHALRFGVSPSHEHRGMLSSLGNINTVVDVGANVGQFALICNSCLPNAKVHSFEPLAKARKVFAKVLEGSDRVSLHPVALGEHRAELHMHVTAKADSSSLLTPSLQASIFPGTHEVGTEVISVMPLEERLSREDISAPALLKIDVQGYELQVLRGCKTLLGCFDYVFVELSFIELYAGQALAPEVIGWLAENGFSLGGCYVSSGSYLNGKMIQGDFLFSRSAVA